MEGKNNFSEFQQNLIKKYNINTGTSRGLSKLNEKSMNSVFINYFADCELVVLKSYLESKYNRTYTEQKVYNIAEEINLEPFDRLTRIPTEQLTDFDFQRISYDVQMLDNLNKRDVFYGNSIPERIKILKLHNISVLNNRYTIVSTLKTKNELKKLGIDKYLRETVPVLLKRPIRKY